MTFNRVHMALAWDQLMHQRKTLFAGLISLIPLLVGVVLLVVDITSQAQPDWAWTADYGEPVRFIILTATVPLTALLLSGSIIADEIEDRTLTYLLVRPTYRISLYASRLAVVTLLTAGLAALQVLSLGLMRLLSYGITAGGSSVETTSGTLVNGGALVASLMPVGMVAAALLAAVLCAVFGTVSLLLPRYHFVANLLIYLFWELPFGQLGGNGPGILTATYYALSLVMRADPTAWNPASFGSAPWFLAVPALLLALGVWGYAGAQVTRRRDFNVTSAAT